MALPRLENALRLLLGLYLGIGTMACIVSWFWIDIRSKTEVQTIFIGPLVMYDRGHRAMTCSVSSDEPLSTWWIKWWSVVTLVVEGICNVLVFDASRNLIAYETIRKTKNSIVSVKWKLATTVALRALNLCFIHLVWTWTVDQSQNQFRITFCYFPFLMILVGVFTLSGVWLILRNSDTIEKRHRNLVCRFVPSREIMSQFANVGPQERRSVMAREKPSSLPAQPYAGELSTRLLPEENEVPNRPHERLKDLEEGDNRLKDLEEGDNDRSLIQSRLIGCLTLEEEEALVPPHLIEERSVYCSPGNRCSTNLSHRSTSFESAVSALSGHRDSFSDHYMTHPI